MVATRLMTIQEFETSPLPGRWELIDGEPIAVTPSSGRSSRIGGRVYSRLADFVEPTEIGWAFPADAGFILFGDRAIVRSPDAAFVRRDRLPEEPAGFVPIAPDIAVEVLSPSDRQPEAIAKVAMYLQAGVRLVWLVDPYKPTVTVFQPDASVIVLGESDILDGGEVLPGFSVAVVDIFA